MLHGREGMEGTEERRHGDFTGVPRGDADPAGGDHAGDQRQQQHQHEQYEQQGEERREDGEHRLIQCVGAELQGAAFHPLHHRRIVPQRQTRQGAGVLGPVHAVAPHAQLHRPREVVAEQRLGIPLHPRSLPDEEGAAAVSQQQQHSDLQNPRGHLLQVQTLQAPPQPIGGQGGSEEATHEEEQSFVSRPEQEQHAVDWQLVLTLLSGHQSALTHTRTCYTTHRPTYLLRVGRRRNKKIQRANS